MYTIDVDDMYTYPEPHDPIGDSMNYHGIEQTIYKNIRVVESVHTDLVKLQDELNEGKYWDKLSIGAVIKALIEEHNAAKPKPEPKGPSVRCVLVGKTAAEGGRTDKDCSTCKGTKRNACYVAEE